MLGYCQRLGYRTLSDLYTCLYWKNPAVGRKLEANVYICVSILSSNYYPKYYSRDTEKTADWDEDSNFKTNTESHNECVYFHLPCRFRQHLL